MTNDVSRRVTWRNARGDPLWWWANRETLFTSLNECYFHAERPVIRRHSGKMMYRRRPPFSAYFTHSSFITCCEKEAHPSGWRAAQMALGVNNDRERKRISREYLNLVMMSSRSATTTAIQQSMKGKKRSFLSFTSCYVIIIIITFSWKWANSKGPAGAWRPIVQEPLLYIHRLLLLPFHAGCFYCVTLYFFLTLEMLLCWIWGGGGGGRITR